MNIAVCDDEREDREELCRDLAEIWEGAQIDVFENGVDVVRKIQQGFYYDLIFLDIIMEQSDGIMTGKEIRRYFPGIELVYISISRDFGPEIYELNALHYLIKPYTREKLEEVKIRFLRRSERRRRAVIHLDREKQQDIPLHMITYIESSHNNLLIHLITGSEVKIRGSIRGFMERLDERFLRINRGVIVNMESIEQMGADSCEIAGITFMLSRKGKAENKKKYSDWLFRSAMGGWDE